MPGGSSAFFPTQFIGIPANQFNDGRALRTISNEIGILNTEVTTLNSDIATLNSDITTINGDITTLNTEVTTINGDITTINGDITTINGDITTINGDITTINSDITTINTEIATLAQIQGGTYTGPPVGASGSGSSYSSPSNASGTGYPTVIVSGSTSNIAYFVQFASSFSSTPSKIIIIGICTNTTNNPINAESSSTITFTAENTYPYIYTYMNGTSQDYSKGAIFNVTTTGFWVTNGTSLSFSSGSYTVSGSTPITSGSTYDISTVTPTTTTTYYTYIAYQ